MSYDVRMMSIHRIKGCYNPNARIFERDTRGYPQHKKYVLHGTSGPNSHFCVIRFDSEYSKEERIEAARNVLHLLILRKEALR